MNIYDLKPLNELKEKKPIYVRLPDGEVGLLVESFNIEDGTLFLTFKEKLTVNGVTSETPLASDSLLDYLDHERLCDCWDGHKYDALFEGSNALYDCDIKVYNAITDQVFELERMDVLDTIIVFYTFGPKTDSKDKPVSLCNLEVDVQMLPDGTFDVYINNEGDSGCHYEHVTADKIGELVTEEVEIRAEGRL